VKRLVLCLAVLCLAATAAADEIVIYRAPVLVEQPPLLVEQPPLLVEQPPVIVREVVRYRAAPVRYYSTRTVARKSRTKSYGMFGVPLWSSTTRTHYAGP